VVQKNQKINFKRIFSCDAKEEFIDEFFLKKTLEQKGYYRTAHAS